MGPTNNPSATPTKPVRTNGVIAIGRLREEGFPGGCSVAVSYNTWAFATMQGSDRYHTKPLALLHGSLQDPMPGGTGDFDFDIRHHPGTNEAHGKSKGDFEHRISQPDSRYPMTLELRLTV